MDWHFEDMGAVRTVPALRGTRLIIQLEQASYDRCVDESLQVGEVLPEEQVQVLADVLGDADSLCRRSIAAILDRQNPDATVEGVQDPEIRIALPQDGSVRIAVLGNCDWDPEHGFGVVWEGGRVRSTGGMSEGYLWSSRLSLRDRSQASSSTSPGKRADARSDRTASEPGPSTLEEAMIRGDFALVDEMLAHEGTVSRTTLACALSQPEPVMQRLVRILRMRGLLPKDPTLAEHAVSDSARSWLERKLR